MVTSSRHAIHGSTSPRQGIQGSTGARTAEADLDRVGARLKALADPTRLRIVSQLLASEEPVCVCDIAACFELSQPTISHHLRTLREAGLVRASRCGTWVYYSPEREELDGVRAALGTL